MGFLRIVPVVVALATAGCATLQTNGSTQRVPVTSAPSGANVFVDGQVVGVTPVEIVVRRRAAEHHVRVEGGGEQTLRRSISWWLLADVGVGVLISVFALAHRQADGVEPHFGHTLGAAAGAGPVLLDFLTGAAFRFPNRVDFSGLGLGQPRAEEPMPRCSRTATFDFEVCRPLGGLGGRALLDIAQLHDLSEGRRQFIDGGKEEAPRRDPGSPTAGPPTVDVVNVRPVPGTEEWNAAVQTPPGAAGVGVDVVSVTCQILP